MRCFRRKPSTPPNSNSPRNTATSAHRSAAPAQSSTALAQSSATSARSTAAPAQSSTALAQSSATSVRSSTALTHSSVAPALSSVAPAQSSTALTHSSAAPAQSYAPPARISMAPTRSSATPAQSSTAPPPRSGSDNASASAARPAGTTTSGGSSAARSAAITRGNTIDTSHLCDITTAPYRPSAGEKNMTPGALEKASLQLAMLLSMEEEHNAKRAPARKENVVEAKITDAIRRTSVLDFRELTREEAIARYDAIVERCASLRVMFIDDSFPPGPQILYENGQCRRRDANNLLVVQHFGGGDQDLDWRRSSHILQRPSDLQMRCDDPFELLGTMHAFHKAVEWKVYQPGGVLPDDVSQGALGNCWFCGVLGAVAATRPNVLHELFVKPTGGLTNRYGVYLVKLFDGGRWVYIALDDYFPVTGGRHGYFLAFSGARRNQLWVPLLEKGYSKLKGNYELAEGGSPADALRLFTGWPSVTQELRVAEEHTMDSDPNTFEFRARCPFIDDDLLWARILSAETAGLIIVGSCGFVQEDRSYKAVGLSSSHCYGIERAVTTSCGQHLLHVRNPWGCGLVWSGPFSDDDRAWTPQIRQEVGYLKREGVFWMPLSELKKYFMTLSLSTYRADWHEHLDVITHTALGEPIWTVHVYDTTEALFSLMQMEEKWNDYMCDLLLIVLKKDGTFVASSNRGTTTNELVDVVLQPGEYVVVPVSMLSASVNDLSIGMGMFFSKSGYEITKSPPNTRLRQKAMAHFAKKSGKEKTYFGDLKIWTAHQAGVTMYVENRSRYRTYRFDVKFSDIFNMEFSRQMRQVGNGASEEFVVIDSVPPMHAMIVIIGTGRVGGYRDAFSTKFQQYDGEIHDPPLCPFHTPFSLL